MDEIMAAPPKVTWRKSSFSNSAGCVEMADLGIAMRDSKDPYGPALRFNRHEVAVYFQAVRDGEFDYLLAPVE
jgi:hypothetical protein